MIRADYRRHSLCKNVWEKKIKEAADLDGTKNSVCYLIWGGYRPLCQNYCFNLGSLSKTCARQVKNTLFLGNKIIVFLFDSYFPIISLGQASSPAPLQNSF